MNEGTKQLLEIEKMLDGAMHIGEKNDPASTTTSVAPLHGPRQSGTGVDSTTQFGIFSQSGARPEVYSTLVRPKSWLNTVPMRRSDFTNELIDFMTGQTAGGTTNAAGWTGNPPEVGLWKTARQAYIWGNYYVKTKLVALPLIAQRRDRGDVYRQIMNMGAGENPLVPDVLVDGRLDTGSVLAYELMRIIIDLERTMEVEGILGTSGDNSRTGWWADFRGLDSIVATGKADSVTNLAVPALDSTVNTFGANISNASADTDALGRTVVTAIDDLYYAIQDNARRMGFGDGEIVAIMRPELYRALVQIWMENYATMNLGGSTSTPIFNEGLALIGMRQDITRRRILPLGEGDLRVEFSDGIALERADDSPQILTSDLFMYQRTGAGRDLLTMEYFPMDNSAIAEFASFFGSEVVRVINNGMYIIGFRSTGLGIELHVGAKFRLIPDATFLMARLDDITFNYNANTRTADPALTYLYRNGGVTYRS